MRGEYLTCYLIEKFLYVLTQKSWIRLWRAWNGLTMH